MGERVNQYYIDADEKTARRGTEERLHVLAHCVDTVRSVVDEILRDMPEPPLTVDLRRRQATLQRLSRVGDLLQSRFLGD